MRFLPKLRVAHKLPMALVITALVASATVGVGSYLLASSALEQQARTRLSTIAFERASQLKQYLAAVQGDVLRTATSAMARGALVELGGSYHIITDRNPTEALQETYITNNPHPPAERMLFDTPSPQDSYGYSHERFNPVFRAQLLREGYRDIYLLDRDGTIVYSAAKREDFATSVKSGPLEGTILEKAFDEAMALKQQGEFVFTDFGEYPFIEGAVSFFAVPITDGMGNSSGVVAFAFPADRMSTVISHRTGLGDTGETVIVGSDGQARSEPEVVGGGDAPPLPALFDPATMRAIAATGDEALSLEFRDKSVIAGSAPVAVSPTQSWSLVALMERAEVLAPISRFATSLSTIGGILLLIAGVTGWFFGGSITRPLARLTTGTKALAEGNLEANIPGADRSDEIGEMARAVEVFRVNARRVQELAEGERAGNEHRQAERAHMMQELQRAFGQVVDAAAAGDFSQRADEAFADSELNSLARSVNSLVATVERGLGETGVVLAALANTDLTKRMQGDYQGDFGRLRDDTNRVCDTLSNVVGNLRRTSGSLKAATSEILAGATDLADRTNRQSATIQQMTTTMGALSGTVDDNAKRAEAATVKADTLRQKASEGGMVMGSATDAMERITDASSKISTIIGLIDDIAFQTNLLALNASVEAARAGEAGEGFAVVAVEVRRLAQSAAQASADVKGLVEASDAEVASGSRLVAEPADKLNAMLDAARESSALVAAIATASREQATSIADVSNAMRTLDEMTQHNAALVEQTNAAIEQTEAQAAGLDRVVEIFKLEERAVRVSVVSASLRA